MIRLIILGLSASILAAPVLAEDGDAKSVDAAASDFFEAKVRPVLEAHCNQCHGPARQKAGLRLDTRAGMMKGGDSGPAITAGSPDASRLVEAIRYAGETQMPPKGKLRDDQIRDLSEWVRSGARWPETAAEVRTDKADPSSAPGGISAEDRAFWSFRPVEDPKAPDVNDAGWPKGAIDRFVLAEIEARGLHPVEAADRRSLIRRATFDLIGLPPTPGEVEAFLADVSPEAFAHVIDRLLANPHYGERWGRHWLDVARYGEDQAHTFEARQYPNGYKYRDWVVKAFNDDKPYDRFIVEQVAGDLMEGQGRDERLAALGLFALGPVYYGGAVLDELDDRVDTLTRGFLGLTVACARCHDHKFDPIPTADYYALAGVFQSTAYKEYPIAPAEVVQAYDQRQAAIKGKTAEVAATLKSESKKLVASWTEQSSPYFAAAWTFTQSRRGDPSPKSADFARDRQLDPAFLDRWVKYLEALPDEKKARLDQARKPAPSGETPRQAWARIKREWPATAEVYREVEKAFALNRDEQERFLPAEAKAGLKSKRAELEKLKRDAPPMYPVVHSLTDAAKPASMKVLLRGNPATPGAEAPRRFLSVLSPEGPAPFNQGSGRLELARAIASPANPLTARVMVNRVWEHHFGRGLVATPSNFGRMGERPSHPALLDHLATRFVASGWSIKALHREIMLTSTYQLASMSDPINDEADPGNVALWRAPRRRLEVEAWRDAMLDVSGNLDATIGGPSVDLNSADNRRRTFYARVSRHSLDGLLRLFDFPDPNITADKRAVTAVPLQQLFVLNSEFMARQAKALAARIGREPGDDAAKVRRAYPLLYARPASDAEVAFGVEFLAAPAEKDQPSRWEQYAQALLASNEFLFVD